MKYQITHQTTFQYSELASISQNEVFLQPRGTNYQSVMACQIDIDPKPQYLRQRIDYFGNIAHLFMVQHPHNQLNIRATSQVETSVPIVPIANGTPPWESVRQELLVHSSPEVLDACQYIFNSALTSNSPAVQEFARQSFPPSRPVLEGGLDLIGRIFNEFSYDKTATTVDTPVDQVLTNKKGVCQDFAHLAISCLRSMGLAARYVSGYLETLPPPGKPKLVGADASHAWLSLFIPITGWIDLDPTNNLISGERHITVAWGRDYADVTPVKGVVMGGGTHSLSVMVDVAAAYPEPVSAT